MSVFGHVKKQKAINDMVNFETFGRSMQLLFRLVHKMYLHATPECDFKPHLFIL